MTEKAQTNSELLRIFRETARLNEYNMKKLFVIILILHFSSGYSQKLSKSDLDRVVINNFSVEDCKVKWKKVFETNLQKDGVIKGISDNQHLIINKISDSTIVGKFENVSIVGTKYGYKDFLTGSLKGDFIVEISEYRYRITIQNIVEEDVHLVTGGKNLKAIEWYALDRSCKFKKAFGFTEYIGKMLEIMFTDWFTIKEHTPDEW